MLEDILMETRAFQELCRKAEEIGRKRAEEKKMKWNEEFKAGYREGIVLTVVARFGNPSLTSLIQERAESIDDKDALRGLMKEIATAQTAADIEELFVNGSDASK